jgi:uncharacterized protein with GYD domain
MNTYVVLLNMTKKGIDTITESGERVKIVRQAVEDAGGRIKDYYLTMGAHDFVVIFEIPDDITMARLLIEVGRLGAVRTTCMRAFGEAEYGEILAGLD